MTGTAIYDFKAMSFHTRDYPRLRDALRYDVVDGMILGVSFLWDATPEGHQYWANVTHELGRTLKLLPDARSRLSEMIRQYEEYQKTMHTYTKVFPTAADAYRTMLSGDNLDDRVWNAHIVLPILAALPAGEWHVYYDETEEGDVDAMRESQEEIDHEQEMNGRQSDLGQWDDSEFGYAGVTKIESDRHIVVHVFVGGSCVQSADGPYLIMKKGAA